MEFNTITNQCVFLGCRKTIGKFAIKRGHSIQNCVQIIVCGYSSEITTGILNIWIVCDK